MEGYFDKYSENLVLRAGTPSKEGLRQSQLGAIHSIASHFTLHDKIPALIVMPTGTGKTAVITMVPFIVKAEKVLVLTSSKLVRGQVTEEFQKLKALKALSLFNSDEFPTVFEKRAKLSDEDIDSLNDADVVIGIPKAIDILFEEEIDYDPEFFDLILVDEAHHRAAKTWAKVVERFPNAKKVLFTATPFRRDKKSIDGKIIYNYPLSKAKEDGSFAEIEFHSAPAKEKQDPDVAIAKKAEAIFRADRDSGLNHYIMVRTNNTAHAQELIDVYKKQTKLDLALVTGKMSFRTAKQTVKKLKDGDLDGIVCVDMLGEGFDFPNLKIAAVHAPHKSEAITLQFIGRFTRTNADDIGRAKFIATPNDIVIGKHRLYEEGAVWQDLIIDVSESAVGAQIEEQEIVSTFEDLINNSDVSDVTLYNFTPYSHVKIYECEGVNLEREIDFGGQVVEHKFLSKEHSILVVLSREDTRPKWVSSEKIFDREYFLYAIHYDKKRKLLFINSSIKSEEVYENLFQCLMATEDASWKYQIQKQQIHKVLLDISGTDFFSVGMLNRMPSSGESYKTLTGSSAQKRINKSDGVLYESGHMFCGGIEDGAKVTIGYSSASKVWSNSYKSITEFLKWCQLVGSKISSTRTVKTNSGFDFLPVSERVTKLPENIVAAFWANSVYDIFPTISVKGEEVQLADLEFAVNKYVEKNSKLSLTLFGEDLEIPLLFSIEDGFQVASDERYILSTGESLNQFLNNSEVTLQTAELNTLIGRNLTCWKFDQVFSDTQLLPMDWKKMKTDITVEFGTQNSIQSCLEKKLMESNAEIVVCDHGAGEAADYITTKEDKSSVTLTFYHVKATSSATPGDRLEDLYEVCGQVVKSATFATDRTALVKKLTSRLSTKPAKFRRGNFTDLNGLIGGNKTLRLKMVIVQPGVSKKKISVKLSTLLSASDSYLKSLGVFEPIEVVCSE